jgi:hypothetical protein
LLFRKPRWLTLKLNGNLIRITASFNHFSKLFFLFNTPRLPFHYRLPSKNRLAKALANILRASSTLGNSSGNFKVAAVEEERIFLSSSSFDA